MTRTLTILLVGFMLAHAQPAGAREGQNIPDDRLVIDGFRTSGNNITKERIILRELVFELGDTIPKLDLIPALQQSRQNILNTSLFNFVYLDVEHFPGNRIIVEITVTERWYIWPVPIVEYAERNFSEFITNREWDKMVYGARLKWDNFRGRNETLVGKIRLGYVNEYSLEYHVPNLGKRQRHWISTGFNLNHQNEVFVKTEFNRPVEYKPVERPAQIRYNAFSKYTYRKKHYSTHTIRLDYYNYSVTDSVVIEDFDHPWGNPRYLGLDPLNGASLTSLGYFKLQYEFRHDVRDSKVYPLDGFLVKAKAERLGLGIITGFPYPSTRLTGVLMFHEKLPGRFYFYNIMKARYSSEKTPPHILNIALGYRMFMSAYEPYVIDGSDFFITKYNLKFQLVKPTTRTLPLIKMEQFNKVHYAFYINLFADAGFVHNEFPNPTNTMVNAMQFSSGIGIDLVTYYDQVIRIDFAINRYREYGIFFHLETPFYRW